MPKEEPSPLIMTIGHSTRTLGEFIGLLQAHGATRVVDVRTVPRSRHNPQFNKISLPGSLKKAGLGYVHLPGLGGLRHAKRDSLNLGWRNASFRGYADYMQTPEFEQSLDELIRLANQDRIVLMCAEAVPWRCHRSLIADALLIHGIRTEDIMSATRRQVHTLTPFAKVRGTAITYPTEASGSTQKKPSAKRSRPQPVAACGEGRRDAMIGVLGMLFGAGTYVALFSRLQPVFKSMSDWGKVTLPQITGTSPWIWIVALAVVIGIALVWLERRHPQPQTSP